MHSFVMPFLKSLQIRELYRRTCVKFKEIRQYSQLFRFTNIDVNISNGDEDRLCLDIEGHASTRVSEHERWNHLTVARVEDANSWHSVAHLADRDRLSRNGMAFSPGLDSEK